MNLSAFCPNLPGLVLIFPDLSASCPRRAQPLDGVARAVPLFLPDCQTTGTRNSLFSGSQVEFVAYRRHAGGRVVSTRGICFRYGCPRAYIPLPAAFELALPGQFLPHRRRELVGRRDRHDARLLPPGHRAVAQPRLIVELRQFQPFSECFEGRLEFLGSGAGRRDCISGRHGKLLGKTGALNPAQPISTNGCVLAFSNVYCHPLRTFLQVPSGFPESRDAGQSAGKYCFQGHSSGSF